MATGLVSLVPKLNLGTRLTRLIFLLLAATGCLTPGPELLQYSRDGVQYGRTEGRFRGRWWNYYERGRSFADGQFWAEAERDFRTALGRGQTQGHAMARFFASAVGLRAAVPGRVHDELWVRTYGLHFLPEYFPNRELGIVLYHQGRYEDAATALETSLGQQRSARAAYYLDKARKSWVESRGADKTPPTIQLTSPDKLAVLASRSVQVAGSARDDTFVARVLVNDSPVPVSVSAQELPFSVETAISPGDNDIRVTAEDLLGKASTVVVRVRCDVDGPAVSFDSPVTVPGRISGVAFDPSGVSQVRIAGEPAMLSPGENGQAVFSIELQKEGLAPPLQYECQDALGNVTQGHVPVNTVMISEIEPTIVFASTEEHVLPLIGKIAAVTVGGQFVALTAIESPGSGQQGPAIRFTDLKTGQKFLMDEIVVGLDIDAANPVAKAQLNGIDLDLIPGRTVQRLSRRVSLQPGVNQLEASAEDTAQQVGTASVAVERQTTAVEQPEGRLSVAVLGNVWKGNSPLLENEAAVIADELVRELEARGRFNLIDRSLLPEVLAEQELSAALSSKDGRLALGKVVPAELVFVGRARRDAESLEIVLEALSTETSLLMGRADVAGSARDLGELRRMVGDLALRVIQDFPRAYGQVAAVKGPETVVTNLNAALGIRPSMKFIVYRYGEEIADPATGRSLGHDTQIIAEMLVKSVDENKSIGERVLKESEPAPPAVQVGDYVVTK